MKRIIAALFILISAQAVATTWPVEIKTKKGGVINIYQPQPESLDGNRLGGRCAFSGKALAGDELIFGVFWFTATLATDRDSRAATLESIIVKEIKLPGIDDSTKIIKLRDFLNTEIPKQNITASLDDITSTLEQDQNRTSPNLKNEAPVVHYVPQTTTLVLIDGEPKLQDDKELKMKRVINTAFLIVENPDDKKYYLYGGQFWYASSSMKDGYEPVKTLPKTISALDQQVKKNQTDKSATKASSPPAILVSITPAELIQSNGPADFGSITGTGLLYVSNSDDDIFRNINDQNYYVLLSGRWYSSPKLEGPWSYIASDKLPADFSKIPEGSAKDNVLSSVPGTPASKEAIMDAQVPQTAKVDRKTATCTVKYDGEPTFEPIEGTLMKLAMNTSSTVIKSGNLYFCVESGVWFKSEKATGPWKVSDQRPKDVDKIPASSPAYNVQFVYIYDSTPEVVYVGYTPGYMGCYVYGGTVVYGTGYYYNPWYGPYYYPMPVTYGYSMHYNPWTGWSMGFHYSTGCFTFSAYYHPAYWGPPMYRPPYYPPYRGGMYGPHGPTYINNSTNININNSNNIYNKRNDVTTSDVKRGQGNQGSQGNRPSTMDQKPSGGSGAGTKQNGQGVDAKNNVYSGKDGSVNKRNDNGSWDQRNGSQWENKGQSSSMDKDYQNRQRSSQQNSNFDQMNHGGNMGGNAGRSGGGGGGRRR